MFIPTLFIFILCANGLLGRDIIGSRILGGDSATSGIAPYLVSIQDNQWKHICSGTIIDTRWIVTSASCALVSPNKNIVPGITTYIPGKAPEIAYHVARATPHQDYFEGETLNDIGIIKTLQTIVYSTKIRALSWSSSFLGGNQALTLVGWDFSVTATSYRLKALTLTSMTNTQCEDDVKPDVIVDSTHLCALRSAGRGACTGDDGLAVVNGGRIQGIVGIINSTTCALGYPEVYTRFSTFYAWVASERSKN